MKIVKMQVCKYFAFGRRSSKETIANLEKKVKVRAPVFPQLGSTPGSQPSASVSDVFSTPVTGRTRSQTLDQSFDTPLSTSIDSTPESQSSRGRGRPRKTLIDPSSEKPPDNLTSQQLKTWNKRHKTRVWRYQKLVSANGEQFRKDESSRVLQYQQPKHKGEEDDDLDDEEDLDGVDYLGETYPETAAKKKEQSRLR